MSREKAIEEPPGSQISLPIVPAAPRRISPPLKVAVLANLKKNVPLRSDAPPDDNVEYDREETVEAILESLRMVGHKPFFLEADASLLDSVRKTKPEFCFNISEGLRGDARESHIPAILEMLGIPYSGSRVLANAISLEKVIAKRIWRDRGLPTVPFQLFNDPEAPLRSTLRFPLFVKPVREGSGKGVSPTSIVQNEEEVRREVRRILQDYHQPALVESFLPGREFTVGIIGNPPSGRKRANPDLYAADGYHYFPVLEIDPNVGAGQGVYGSEAKAIVPGEEGSPVYKSGASPEGPPRLQPGGHPPGFRKPSLPDGNQHTARRKSGGERFVHHGQGGGDAIRDPDQRNPEPGVRPLRLAAGGENPGPGDGRRRIDPPSSISSHQHNRAGNARLSLPTPVTSPHPLIPSFPTLLSGEGWDEGEKNQALARLAAFPSYPFAARSHPAGHGEDKGGFDAPLPSRPESARKFLRP
jgi:hypothetical protein